MRVSIITAVFNRAITISDAITSVQQQKYANVEHVIIDGASTDGTLDILRDHLDSRSKLFSEPDNGIYDALNKGLARATGDIIGVMHSDDLFADENVLADVAKAFENPSIEAVYGDLEYVAQKDIDHVIRHWRAGEYDPARLRWGWMPPHPTLFLRKQVIEQFGGYDTQFRIAADYDAILRYFGQGRIRASYIPRVLVKMRFGGESNQSFSKILRKSREDYIALRRNGIGGIGALAWKNLSKLVQFL